jgi:hypothetical protein
MSDNASTAAGPGGPPSRGPSSRHFYNPGGGSAAPLKNIQLAADPDAAALGHGAEGLRGPRRISPFAPNPATAAGAARNQAAGATSDVSSPKSRP